MAPLSLRTSALILAGLFTACWLWVAGIMLLADARRAALRA